jgi:hypothetical protein
MTMQHQEYTEESLNHNKMVREEHKREKDVNTFLLWFIVAALAYIACWGYFIGSLFR